MSARLIFVLAWPACSIACEAETLRLTPMAIALDAGIVDVRVSDPLPDAEVMHADAAVMHADAAEALPDAVVVPLDPETIVEVSSGGHHSCVRRASGRVTCWGSPNSADLSAGEAMEGSQQLAMGGYPSVALAGGHTCSVREDGQVWCWGDNYNGQLGRGEGLDARLEAAPMLASNVVRVAASAFHTCVIDQNRALFCAGLNNAAQLALPPDEIDHGVPVPIAGIEDVVKVAIGGWHMCAILSDGSARCWGATLWGKLGTGRNPGGDYQSTPQPVLDLTDAIDISAQHEHTCALRRSGQIACWGDNHVGQLGYGRQDSWGNGTPQTVLDIDDATAVAVGEKHSCALRASGEVWCWGSNEDGRLGADSMEMFLFSPVRVVGIERAIGLSSGQKHSCALIEGEPRTVMCWGRNGHYELGDGRSQNSPIPVRATAADL